ncbi:MAG: PA14 domain-containing protein [Bacteroidetes bacterium]|nr:PA14 domain-containing protein [Bacteroidota bacterium]
MKKILLAVLIMIAGCSLSAQIIYVTPNGAGLNNGSSWENALGGNTPSGSGYTGLADSMRLATSGKQFWIAEGIYKVCVDNDREKSFELGQNIRLYGGFAGTETDTLQRNLPLHTTVFSGDIGVQGDSTDNTKIILKTISVPWTIYSYIDGIDFLRAYNSLSNTIGTGIYNTGLLAVRNCNFKNNYSANYGAGIHNARDLHAEKCLFYNNRAYAGGGLYNSWTNGFFPAPYSVVKSSIFSNNKASGDGGGIRNEGIVSVINTLIVNNNSSGIYSMSATMGRNVTTKIYNSTFANNSGPNVYIWMGIVTIVNSVSWGSTVGFDYNPVKDIRYSTIQGYTGNPLISISDPQFVNPSAGTGTGYDGLSADWSLRWCSPAINAGADSLIPAGITTDIDGNPRIRYAAVDHGAYEFDSAGVVWNIVGFANNRIYVTDSNAYYGAGSSWANAVAGNAESCKYTGQSMLYEAMKDAPAGKEIWMKKGTYKCSISSNRNHAFTIASGVKIYGGFEGNEAALAQRGSGITLFSGDIGVPGVPTDNALHVFNINPDGVVYTDSARADGITVMNGYAGSSDGAGILVNSNSKVKFSNIIVRSNNSTGKGSGISIKTMARVTISNSNFRNNTGYGIYSAGRLSVSNSIVKTSSSTGLFSTDSLWLNNCNIDSNGVSGIISSAYCSINGGSLSGNLASIKGGAIYNKTGAKMVAGACNISGNASNSSGGGVFNEGVLELRECNISNNTAKDNGGGIANAAGANCLVTRSAIAFNQAVLGWTPAGGGVYNSGTFNIETSRICNNETPGYGGGIYNPTKIKSCVIANNSKTGVYRTGGGIFIISGFQGIFNSTVANNTGEGISSTTLSGIGTPIINPDTFQVKNSIIYGNDSQLSGRFNVSNSCLLQQQPGAGNIFANPLWINPTTEKGPVYNAMAADWGLKRFSGCMNGGDNAYLSAGDTSDVVGNPRVMHGNVDMGGIESPYPPDSAVPVTNTVIWEIFKPRPANIQTAADETWQSVVLERLETPSGTGDNTTQSRIRGLLLPQISGYYRFYLASDIGGKFLLSTDSTELHLIQRCTNASGSTSWPTTLGKIDSVYLQAGKSFYFEAFCQSASAYYPLNYLKIGWTQPGSNTLLVIIGDYLRQADQKQTYSLKWELFKNKSTYNFSDLKNTTEIPDEVIRMDSIITGDRSTSLDHFTSRVRGYLIPPVSGNYSFYFAAADQGQFWLSSDTSVAGAQLKSGINSTQTNWAQNISSQTLTAGQKYFFEILHYDTTYTDLVKLGWIIPGTTTPAVIRAPYIMSYRLDVPITAFSLIDRWITAFPSWQITPRINYTPWNATFRNLQQIRWNSTNNAIAQVNSYGTITLISPGTCRIIAKVTMDTTLTDTLEVTVINYYGPWFVKQNADDSGNGHSWESAIRLPKLLDILNQGTSTQIRSVFVAEGIYKPTSTIDRNATFLMDNVRITGGFPANNSGTDTTTRNCALHETILGGDINVPEANLDNSYHVVTARNNSVIDGFTIRDGTASCSTYGYTLGYYQFKNDDNGGGVIIPQIKSNVLIQNCKLTNNMAWNSGGAICLTRASTNINLSSVLTVKNSSFIQNWTQQSLAYLGGYFNIIVNCQGGAVSVITSTLNTDGCFFSLNTSMGNGKAIYLENGAANLQNSSIYGTPGNSQDLYAISASFFNLNNFTLNGTITGFASSTLNIKSSTIRGGGSLGGGNDPVTIDNSIWTGMSLSQIPDPTLVTVKHSILGSTLYGTAKTDILATNLPGPTTWLDTLASNGGPTPTMRLKNIAGNPAKTHGNPAYLGTTDQRGYSRNDTVSIGAYQWVWPSSVTINPDNAILALGDSLGYTVSVLPETADDKTWSAASSDSAIATAGNSFLHAKTMGSAQVTVRTHDGIRRDTCFVTVMNDSANATGIISPYGSSCYSALHTIRVAGNGDIFMVQNGGISEMIAGENILYLPGTKVEHGGYMHGYIAPGGPWCQSTKSSFADEGSAEIGQIPESSQDSEPVSVWPNPTTGKITIEIESSQGISPVMIRCYDQMGTLVLKEEFSLNRHEMNLENRLPGIYFLHIQMIEGSKVVKVIKF